MNPHDRSIRQKLVYLFAGIGVVLLLAAGSTAALLSRARSAANDVLKTGMDVQRLAQESHVAFLTMKVIENSYLEKADQEDLSAYHKLGAQCSDAIQGLVALSPDPAAVLPVRELVEQERRLFERESAIVGGLAQPDDPNAFRNMLKESDELQHRITGLLDSLSAGEQKRMRGGVETIFQTFSQMSYALAFAACMTLAALVTAYLGGVRVAAGVSEITLVAREVTARGALNQVVRKTSNDEIGQLAESFNQMIASLKAMVGQMRNSTSDLTTVGAQILAAAAQQSSSATEQAASVTEATSTIEEIRQTAAQAMERAQEMIDVADRSAQVSKTGAAAVDQAIVGINDVRARVNSIATNILTLSERTQQIEDIIATVNELAERSNLLAVNASIEAAKAAEHGKGFAVVAGEVRSLADQSKVATKQVRSMLGDIQRATNTAVMVTEEGAKRADSAVKQAEQAGLNISELTQVIHTAAQAARQIATSSRQQALGIDQIVIAFRHINESTGDAVAGARQTETSAGALKQLSDRMRDLVAPYGL